MIYMGINDFTRKSYHNVYFDTSLDDKVFYIMLGTSDYGGIFFFRKTRVYKVIVVTICK